MTDKEIERQLFAYRENAAKAKATGRNKALEWLAGGAIRVSCPTHRNGTENAVINAVSDADELARWCRVFEKTLDRFRFTPKEIFIRARYLDRKEISTVCLFVGISERTFSWWRREIIEIARKWAQELNLID